MELKFSQDLKVLLQRLADKPLTLADILEETSERGFSLIIGLLALPFLVPVPPGVTTLPSLACLLLSLQMALGRRSPWLPRRVAQFRFPKVLMGPLLGGLRRVSKLMENVARPRWTRIAEHPRIWQLNGLCLSWLAFLLMTPVPFTNQMFSLSILTFVIATLEADGLLMCVGYVFTLAFTAVLFFILYVGADIIKQYLPNFLQWLS